MPAPTMSSHLPMTSGRLVDVSSAALPLERSALSVDARGGLARVTFVQRFANPHDEPLSVTYKLPLPADAAVSGFTFRVGARTIRGTVDGKARARERFERAVIEGRGAALLEQERSSLFTQEIANIPPREAVEIEVELDQPLAWLVEGRWEWRFPLAAAPRYLGAGPAEGAVAIAIASGDVGARASLSMRVRDAVPEGRSPESPSHPIVCDRAMGSFGVELGSGNAVQLDRDVVVRWPVATLTAGASLDVARPRSGALATSAYGLLSLVPPSPEAKAAPVARDLTLLIDTSGSMSGEPLEQAKRVALALIDSLNERDQLELIEFSSEARAFTARPEAATAAHKGAAQRWVRGLEASGGTEMLSGVKSALRALRPGSQRQIVLITDGLVGFEREIVRALLDGLPPSARLHALGVGSAVNRSLLAPIARAGRGVEAIIGLGEDPERAARRILARTAAPIVVDLRVEGSAVVRTVPVRLPDVFFGHPLRVAVELKASGGELHVRGRTADGPFERTLRVPATDLGEGSPSVTKLFGRELVEDLEVQVSAGRAGSVVERAIEDAGIAFEIATRFTSWIAVTDEALVDPRDALRHVEQPHELPYGMSAAGLGLRPAEQAAADAESFTRTRAGVIMRMRPSAIGMAPGAAPPPMPARAMAKRAPSARDESPMEADDALFGASSAESADLEREEGGARPTGAPAAPEEARTPERPAARKPTAMPSPAPEAPQGRAKSSLFESAKRKIAQVFEKEKKEDASAPRQPAVLAARIALVEGDRVTVELVVPPSGLSLSFADATATLLLPDGTSVTAVIRVDLSARERVYAAGLTVRIVLEAATGARPLGGRIELPTSGVILELR
jgi:Ca-activated chloride channel family protein